MGQTQSRATNQKTLVVSEETTKIEFFSNIFIRLLKTSDILDIRALTSGQGSCGQYVIILAKNIEKEFKKIKLQTRGTNSGATNDFLYASTNTILKQSPSDQEACRYLAIFYIRVLQLVAALTMSIYSPPDLLSRIRNRVYDASLKLQKKGIKTTVSKNEDAQRRQRRENWLLNLLLETEKTNIFTLGDKTQFEYNRVTNELFYTSNKSERFTLRMEVKESDEYSVSPKYLTNTTYWIEVTNNYKNPTDRKILYRALTTEEGGGWVFESSPDLTAVEEEPYTGYYDDWAHDLENNIINNVDNVYIEKTEIKAVNSYGNFGVRRQRLTQRNSKAYNGSKTGTKRNNTASKQKVIQNSLNLAEKTSLPPKFKDSYRAMTKWLAEISDWAEAAPASYRATLLFNKPSLPTTPGSTYTCVDSWANQRLRQLAPFASLEILFFDKDDGTASPENAEILKRLSNEFSKIYQRAPPGESGILAADKSKVVQVFDDVFVPPLGDFLQKNICIKRTAQGESLIEEKYAIVFEKAQTKIIENYKEHLDTCFAMLNSLFSTEKVGSETKIRFSDSFINAKNGARNELEENIIPDASTIIANHYLDIEKIYYEALVEISTLK